MRSESKILIVDDEKSNIDLQTSILQTAGYTEILGVAEAREAIGVIEEWGPDIVLLDLMMPHMDGFELVTEIRRVLPDDAFLPVLVITADAHPGSRQRALGLGADDFISRPFEIFDLVLRVRNLLKTRSLHLELKSRNANLETAVRKRTQELEISRRELLKSRLEIIDRLALCGEFRDESTGLHTYRVARNCRLIAQQMGLNQELVEDIRRAAPLHDVGKIGISDTILLKPGKLTPQEFEIMKTHTVIGSRLLAGGNSDLLQTAERIALNHHERWDGAGYPAGLAGESIPIESRVVAVSDVYDALTHERPYKPAWTVEAAGAEILSQSGRQFDPDVVQAFRFVLAKGELTT